MNFTSEQDQQVWQEFITRFAIDAHRQQQFKQYFDLMVSENQKYNITAITGTKEIVLDHFCDSLAIMQFQDFTGITCVVDVGSGGGLPGIPLAIMFPDIQFHLIEVIAKKVNFLTLVARELGLANVTVHSQDWRNFLRTFDQKADLFVARASLAPEELIRVFQPSYGYQNSVLVYWASQKWVPTIKEKKYLDRCFTYDVGDKKRSLCYFGSKNF